MALAGLFAGFSSLHLIHSYWNQRCHRVRGWIYISLIMIVSLFGVFLGRFLRFKSWDIVNEPLQLFREILSLLLHPNTLPQIWDTVRATGQVIYGRGFMNMYGFIALYFIFYMLLYIFLYQTKKVR